MIHRLLTFSPWESEISGCGLVLQTFWRIVISPAFARPRMRIQKHLNLLRSLSSGGEPVADISVAGVSMGGQNDSVVVVVGRGGRGVAYFTYV